MRLHMLALGHPNQGDTIYSQGAARDAADRLQLHAQMLQFAHPDDRKLLRFERPAPF
jgi:tRNA pseudouridine32 synthase/23S rRNA pseudouridine746 synthase